MSKKRCPKCGEILSLHQSHLEMENRRLEQANERLKTQVRELSEKIEPMQRAIDDLVNGRATWYAGGHNED